MFFSNWATLQLSGRHRHDSRPREQDALALCREGELPTRVGDLEHLELAVAQLELVPVPMTSIGSPGEGDAFEAREGRVASSSFRRHVRPLEVAVVGRVVEVVVRVGDLSNGFFVRVWQYSRCCPRHSPSR